MFSYPFRASCHRLPDDFRHLRHLVNAHERVYLGQQLRQFIPESLRQTARHDEALTAIPGGADFGGF
jgi:hypothetical protein